MSEKQSYITGIEHKRIDGGWHQYTVYLQPGLSYSWENIIANADSVADADLAPIVNVQLQTAWGMAKDLMTAYKDGGFRFSKTKELTENEGNMLCIGGISKALGRPTMITWFNQVSAFGITTEKERSDELIRRYAETIVAKRLDSSTAQTGRHDKEKTIAVESTGSIGGRGIKKITQCRTEAGENGMFPHGDSLADVFELEDMTNGIRRYERIYRYEIELDPAPLKWRDCLRAATNMIYLGVLVECITYGCGKLEARAETDVTNSLCNNSSHDLRLVPELKKESDFVAVRGHSSDLDVDIKVYFHNNKSLVTLYAPIADITRIREYAETKLCQLLVIDVLGRDDEEDKMPASATGTGKVVLSKSTASSDDFVIENGVLTKYTGKGGSVIIPDSVTSIGEKAFKECESLTDVTIPDSVKSIGSAAFEKCTSLTGVTIPNSVTSIGDDAFWGCKNLTRIFISKRVTSIGNGAFSGCSSLADQKGFVIVRGVLYGYFGKDSNVVVPSSVTRISDWAFSGCRMASITIPDSVVSIGEHAFMACAKLTSIVIPDSVAVIGSGAFGGCKGLADQKGFIIVRGVLYDYSGADRNVVIPDGVIRIDDRALVICSNPTRVTIPNSVTSIGESAFSGLKSLTSITIPDSVTNIGDWAFSGCESLTGIIIPGSVTSIGSWTFNGCKSLKSVTILDGVTNISNWAFNKCKSLKSITIPDSITSIGNWAFDECESLTSITIPKRLEAAFEKYKSIKKINYIDNPSSGFWQNLFRK